MPDPAVPEPAVSVTPPAIDYARPRRAARVPWAVWAIVAVALLLRVAFAMTRSVGPAALAALPDQVEYVAIADSIRHGRGIEFTDDTFHDLLRAYRMPGYPALIAACGGNPRVVQIVQAALDGSAALAVFLIGRRLGRDGLGTFAAAAVAVHPYLIYFASLILSETLFTAMLAWAVWALLSPRLAVRLGGVGLLVAAVYVRPAAAALSVVAAACAFYDGPTPGWRRLRAAAAAVVAVMLLLAALTPWAVRNAAVTGHWVWSTTNDGFTAYDSFNPKADGSSNQRWFRAEMARDEQAEARRMAWLYERQSPFAPPPTAPVVHDEVGRSRRLSAMAWDYARTHPARVVSLAVAKLARFWSPVPLSTEFGGRLLYFVVGGLYVVPLFAFAVVGVVRGGLGTKMINRTTLVLLLPALYFSAVHSLAVGSLRYRVPCDVPLAVLAAAGVLSLRRNGHDGRTPAPH